MPDSDDEHLIALRGVYAEASRLFALHTCPSSATCCRFGLTGREPYVTSIELYALRRAIAARGGQGSWRRERSLNGAMESPAVTKQMKRCPLLTDTGRCAAYDLRPLGCRSFYCDRATLGTKVRQSDINELVRRVREIAVRHQPGGDQGRLLTRALLGGEPTFSRRP